MKKVNKISQNNNFHNFISMRYDGKQLTEYFINSRG